MINTRVYILPVEKVVAEKNSALFLIALALIYENNLIFKSVTLKIFFNLNLIYISTFSF